MPADPRSSVGRWPHQAPPSTHPIEPGPPPTFSVIIAAYEAAGTIAAAVDSALDQTVPPHEVVVVDDGSTDATEAALAPHLDRITFIRHEHNGGEGAAKTTAVRAATGDFVVILDADDVFLPERLEALGELGAARPDLDILTTDAQLVLGGKPIRRAYAPGWTFELDDQRRGILERNFVFGHAAARRRAVLDAGCFDESIRRTTDWDLWLRMIFAGSRVGLVDRPLSWYRLHEEALSSDRLAMTLGKIQTLEKAESAGLGLSDEEAGALERSLARLRRTAALEQVRTALIDRAPGARRRALGVARDRSYGLGTRLKAAAGAASPALAGRLLRKRRGDGWVGVADIEGATRAGGQPSQ
jgi:hypothetical protein